jgi:hypothetical protein
VRRLIMGKRIFLQRIFLLLSFLFVIIFLHGCGGGSGGGSNFVPSGDNRAILGPVRNAQVKVYDAYTNELVYETKTDTKGFFNIRIPNPDGIYIVEISNGTDIDLNDDGIEGDTAPVRVPFHAIYVPKLADKFNVTFISDVIYLHLRSSLPYIQSEDLIKYLNIISSKLLNNATSYTDVLSFNPLRDKGRLRVPWNLLNKLIK